MQGTNIKQTRKMFIWTKKINSQGASGSTEVALNSTPLVGINEVLDEFGRPTGELATKGNVRAVDDEAAQLVLQDLEKDLRLNIISWPAKSKLTLLEQDLVMHVSNPYFYTYENQLSEEGQTFVEMMVNQIAGKLIQVHIETYLPNTINALQDWQIATTHSLVIAQYMTQLNVDPKLISFKVLKLHEKSDPNVQNTITRISFSVMPGARLVAKQWS